MLRMLHPFRTALPRAAPLLRGRQQRWKSEEAARDEELVQQMREGEVKLHELERLLKPDYERAVRVRRAFMEDYLRSRNESERTEGLTALPYEGFDYSRVAGRNIENVVGFVPVPVGLAGPVLIDGREYPIPMATTEGALVASTHRGARTISRCGGVTTHVFDDGMTRAPLIEFPNLRRAAAFADWLNDNIDEIRSWFQETTRFGRLTTVRSRVVGRKVYVRCRATTGDAMGMNMISKGTELIFNRIKADAFPDMKVLSLSGNYCTDKKPSAVNWIEGRGKCVVAEAVIPESLVRTQLKTDVDTLVSLNVDKNLIGSAMAGSIGGFNAHAANSVAAIFLATGQDPAQVVESSTAITVFEKVVNPGGEDDGSLRASVTMPSVEVGTVGGGTHLPAQAAVLDLIGCAGPNKENPGQNARLLSRVVCAGVLCSEVSLMAGLSAGHLVRAHMQLNRRT
eukprot:Hpha_TRINITY_DN16147_c4_g3::TRINITY_DN16147_c4_g3_i1::g.6180::m.6180/K00021/HMGCR; hydroxymethylglutaryl-CoA reductase (NADPH)